MYEVSMRESMGFITSSHERNTLHDMVDLKCALKCNNVSSTNKCQKCQDTIFTNDRMARLCMRGCGSITFDDSVLSYATFTKQF